MLIWFKLVQIFKIHYWFVPPTFLTDKKEVVDKIPLTCCVSAMVLTNFVSTKSAKSC